METPQLILLQRAANKNARLLRDRLDLMSVSDSVVVELALFRTGSATARQVSLR